MDASLKTKWVEALRSGKYKQGRNRLKQDDAYCCLGVLCDILDKKKWKKRGDETYWGENNFTCLPDALIEEQEITRKQETVLIENNDAGVPFSQIADMIEKDL